MSPSAFVDNLIRNAPLNKPPKMIETLSDYLSKFLTENQNRE